MLKRAQIYGAVAFYLDHKAEIEKYLEETEREFEAGGIPMAQANPALWEKNSACPRQNGRGSLLSIRFQADNDLKFAIVRVRRRESLACGPFIGCFTSADIGIGVPSLRVRRVPTVG
jgi:hypothetical protein